MMDGQGEFMKSVERLSRMRVDLDRQIAHLTAQFDLVQMTVDFVAAVEGQGVFRVTVRDDIVGLVIEVRYPEAPQTFIAPQLWAPPGTVDPVSDLTAGAPARGDDATQAAPETPVCAVHEGPAGGEPPADPAPPVAGGGAPPDPVPDALPEPAPVPDIDVATADEPAPEPEQGMAGGLKNAADPYTSKEMAEILRLHDDGASNGEIAALLSRRAQGFHHVVTRLVSARVAPEGVSQRLWDRLVKLGNSKLWTPDLDLLMAQNMQGGMKVAHVAQLLELEPRDVSDRWAMLCPDRSVKGAIDALVVALKLRAAHRVTA